MRRDYLICLGLLAINLIAFGPATHLGFIILDDPVYVSKNPNVQGGITADSVSWAFTSMDGNWHPVTWLSHMVDCELFGLNTSGHHWMNLAYHIASTLLLFLVLSRMTSFGSEKKVGAATSQTEAVWCSALVAALFAVHPTHIESVAWIAERKDVLSGFFMMLTLWAWVRYVQGRSRVEGPGSMAGSGDLSLDFRHQPLDYWLAVVFFALGVMSKPMLVSLPLILLLLDFWPLGRVAGDTWRVASDRELNHWPLNRPVLHTVARRRINQLLLEKLPFAALSAISCLATLRAQGEAGFIIHVAPLPWYVRVIITPFFYVAYLKKLFWPENLAIFYPYPLVYHWQILCASLLLIFVSVLCLRQARTRGYLLVGWFWFLVMLVPVIGLVQVGTQSIADRYTYLPSIGLFIIVAWGLAELAARSTALANRHNAGGGGGGAGLSA